MTTALQTVRAALDEHPDYVDGVASLADWGQNEEYPTAFSLFLDIIGWSGEEYGEATFFPYPQPTARSMSKMYEMHLGYCELAMLADALSEYARRPVDVRQWIDHLMELED